MTTKTFSPPTAKPLCNTLLSTLLVTLIVGCNPTDPQTPNERETASSNLPQLSASACTQKSTPIHDIRGEFSSNPLANSSFTAQSTSNQPLTTHGVVTEKRFGTDEGYFIQSLEADENPNTSEGIFILGNPLSVGRGDWIRVSGTLRENEGMTQFSASELALCGRNLKLPKAQPLSLPFNKRSLEALEGMRVSVENALITNTYLLARYGELTLGTRLQRVPSDKAIPLSQEFNALSSKNREFNVVLEDNLSLANPDGLSYFGDFGYANRLKVGDYINAEGVLFYSNHKFRISASQPELTQVLPQIERPLTEPETGQLRIASFNLLNYFNGQHNAQGKADFSRNARGATTEAGFKLQEKRLLSALQAINADAVGLLELENDGFEKNSAITRLINQLNQGQPKDNQYAYVKPNNGHSLGSDRITVGLIYRPAQLTLKEAFGVLMPTQSKEGTLRQMRPSLAADFVSKKNIPLRIVVNHFKSKGSACWEDLHQPSQQDVIQGRCNALRVSAAAKLAQTLTADRSAPNYQILLGDFNAYSYEDPIQLLGGYNAQFHPYRIKGALGVANAPKIPERGFGFIAPAKTLDPNGFSYIYRGQAGSLDHILVSPSLAPRVAYLRHWNINSLETSGFRPDNLFENFTSNYHRQNYYQVGPFASSDHDPVIMDIRLK